MEKYTLLMRIMHWLVAIMVFTLLTVGLYMTSLPDGDQKFAIYPLHKAFGIITLLLITLRLIIRFRSYIPPLPSVITKFDTKLAAATVLLLYVCMFAMPISGYLMSTFSGYEVKVFIVTLPKLVGEDKGLAHVFRDIHEAVAYTLIGLIVLHLAGNIKHYIIEKVNLLARMW